MTWAVLTSLALTCPAVSHVSKINSVGEMTYVTYSMLACKSEAEDTDKLC